MIGGEHSVSAPIIQAHHEKFKDLSVLQIDAHADLRDEYDGTPHSHASIMARVVRTLEFHLYRLESAQFQAMRQDR
ncbi:MAG: arginase family protein [Chloracidobacterium sp.]|nr:arginase family protein [Chloracidobacterium sp.]